MPVDRIIFKTSFYKGNPPQWVCPTCGKGILKGDNKNFIRNEIKSSRGSLKHGDHESVSYVYSCMFMCSNLQCKETVANIGIGSVDMEPVFSEDEEYPSGIEYYDSFKPVFFEPSLNVFNIPLKTPEDIKSEIRSSFRLFFANPSASSNHVRIALELMLDFLKIKKFETKEGKRMFVSLHRRITLLPKKFDEFKEYFYAIKWLGNAGSHNRKISMDDVMDSYDILETILYELFEKRTKSIKNLAKKINFNKGPKN